VTEPAATTRLTAIAAAVPASTAGTFGHDGTLDEPTMWRVHEFDLASERFEPVWCAPEPASRETAAGLGLARANAEEALRSCDFGAWQGRSFAEVQVDDPEAFARWATDVETRPPGGESLADVLGRVRSWLDAAPTGQRVAVVASAVVVRALVVAAIRAPASTLTHVDVEPLGVAHLNRHAGRWRLRTLNARWGP
jgi:broad specificity phosphatase PhoE